MTVEMAWTPSFARTLSSMAVWLRERELLFTNQFPPLNPHEYGIHMITFEKIIVMFHESVDENLVLEFKLRWG